MTNQNEKDLSKRRIFFGDDFNVGFYRFFEKIFRFSLCRTDRRLNGIDDFLNMIIEFHIAVQSSWQIVVEVT